MGKILTSFRLSVHNRNKAYIVCRGGATWLISCFGDIWSGFCNPLWRIVPFVYVAIMASAEEQEKELGLFDNVVEMDIVQEECVIAYHR